MEFLGRFVAFCLMMAWAAAAGWRLSASLPCRGSLAERLLACTVVSAGLVSLAVLALGLAGRLALPAMLVIQAAVWAAAQFFAGKHPVEADATGLYEALAMRRGSRAPGAAIWVALTVLTAVVMLGLFRPHYDYDTLTNHLFAPARWIQTGSLHLVPTPFGAPTAAYEPMNTELLYAWLLLPFHADLVARFGQVLHLAVLYLAVYVIARRLGLSRSAAAVAPLAVHVVVPLVSAAEGAMTDLALAAWWTATLALLLRLRDEPGTGTAAVAGVALGLALGTKFVALVYLPVLVGFALYAAWGSGRRAASWAALFGGFGLLLGGYWYARNWALTGNPLYPLQIELGGARLLPGAFGSEQITAWVFNRRVPGQAATHLLELLSNSLGRASLVSRHIGPLLPLAVLAGALGLTAAGRSTALRGRSLAVLASVPVLVATVWLVLPSHAPRFLFPALALFTLAPAVLAGSGRSLGLVLLALVPFHIGLNWEFYFGGTPPVWVLALAIVPAAIAAAANRLRIDRRRWGSAAAAAVLLASFVVMKAAYDRPLEARMPAFAAWRGLGQAWTWLGRNVAGARIAYSGNNIPYFLLGPRLENEAFYVNTDEHADWSYHDYVVRFASEYPPPFTSEPAYYRTQLDEGAWLDNLESGGVDYLFLSSLLWNERANIRHSRSGFVVEEAWASRQSGLFVRTFANASSRIYRLEHGGPRREPTPPVRRAEIDAVELYLTDRAALEQHYPGASRLIRQGQLLDYARRRHESSR